MPFTGKKEPINLEQVLEKLDSIGKAWVRPLLGLKHSTMLEDDLWGAKTRATIYGTEIRCDFN